MTAANQTQNQVLMPGNLTELFSLWNRIPGAVPFAGGTNIMHDTADSGSAPRVFREQPELPNAILSLEKIEDLHNITRTERYLELGAMVRLSDIIALGKIVPHAFSRTLQGIANPPVRNMATIGGNICSGGDSLAALCALDAVYELRNAGNSRWVSAFRYSSMVKNLQKGELLTRIRVPLEEWNYTVYRKFNSQDSGGEGGVLILIVRNQKNMLTGIQVIFIGFPSGETQPVLLRDKESEAFLEGKALPLDRRDAGHYRKFWEAYLDTMHYPGLLLRDKILNAIETGIYSLSG